MYNEDLKNKFLHESSTNESSYIRMRTVLQSAEPCEVEWGADICTRNEEELASALGKIIGVRKQTRMMGLSILRRYARWCLDNHVPGATNAMLSIKDVGLEKTVNSMVSSPSHLQERLDRIFSPEHDLKIDNTSRSFIWMGFSGLDDRDTVRITARDLDFKNMVIRLDGKEYPIYKEAVPALRHASLAEVFVYEHPNYETVIKRVSGESILRGIREETGDAFDSIRTMTGRRVRAAAKLSFEKFELTYRKTKLSGIFYRVYLKERQTGECDFTEALASYIKERPDVSNDRQKRILSELEDDYSRWKAAFNL